MGIKFYDLATKRDSMAPCMLPTFCTILKTLKTEKKHHDPSSNTTQPEAVSKPSNPESGTENQNLSQMQEPVQTATPAILCPPPFYPSDCPGVGYRVENATMHG